MTLSYVTDSIGFHQVAVADELYSVLGDNFKFIELKQDDKLGLIHKEAEQNLDFSSRPYVIKAYQSDQMLAYAKKLIEEADVVRSGSIDVSWLLSRILRKKLTFWTTERLFKKKLNVFSPRCIIRSIHLNNLFRHNPNFYLLANGAYVANDYRFFNTINKRIINWGYFPVYQKQDYSSEATKSNSSLKFVNILWCARMIDWKRPLLVPKLAKRLLNDGYREFKIRMIGTGTMYNNVQVLIDSLGVSKYVELLGGQPNEQTIQYMNKSDIFLFTSNREEGWGVVLNEAMNAKCAVVASHDIGSVPQMIQHGVNGLIFESSSFESMVSQVKILLDDSKKRNEIAENALLTIENAWSPRIAAKRFISLCDNIIKGQNNPFSEGLCSYQKPYKYSK